jgi:hypothetical protein
MHGNNNEVTNVKIRLSGKSRLGRYWRNVCSVAWYSPGEVMWCSDYFVTTFIVYITVNFTSLNVLALGWDSSVTIAIGWMVQGSNPGRDEIFCTHGELALGPTQASVQWVPGLYGWYSSQGLVLTTHPLLAPTSREFRAIPLHPLWAFESVTGYLYPLHVLAAGTVGAGIFHWHLVPLIRYQTMFTS